MESQETIFNDISSSPAEASTAQTTLTGVVDFVVQIGILVLAYFLFREELYDFIMKYKSVPFFLYIIIWSMIYRIVSIFVFQRTPGMMVSRIRYLNEKFEPLSPVEKIIAVFVGRTKKVRMYKS